MNGNPNRLTATSPIDLDGGGDGLGGNVILGPTDLARILGANALRLEQNEARRKRLSLLGSGVIGLSSQSQD